MEASHLVGEADPSVAERLKAFVPGIVGTPPFPSFLQSAIQMGQGATFNVDIHHLHRALGSEALVAMGQDQLDRGESLLRQALSLAPEAATYWYNLACVQSLRGKIADAAESLEQAAGHGFMDVQHLMADADLENLRKLPMFQSLCERLRTPAPATPPAPESASEPELPESFPVPSPDAPEVDTGDASEVSESPVIPPESPEVQTWGSFLGSRLRFIVPGFASSMPGPTAEPVRVTPQASSAAEPVVPKSSEAPETPAEEPVLVNLILLREITAGAFADEKLVKTLKSVNGDVEAAVNRLFA